MRFVFSAACRRGLAVAGAARGRVRPLSFAFAGGLAVLAEVFSAAVLPLAFSAGLLLQAAYPGDFGYTFRGGGPALASWVAALGGAAALVAAPFIRRSSSRSSGAG